MGKSAPIVPNGWKAQFDEEYQTWFYVDLKTGKSQWEAPEGTTFPPEEQPPSYTPKQDAAAPQQAQPQAQQQARPMYQQQQQYPAQPAYPQQYPQYPQQYPPQQPVYYQQPPQQHSNGRSRWGGAAMGAGAGVLGGLALGSLLTPHYVMGPGYMDPGMGYQQGYENGYDNGYDNGFDNGFDNGGDFGGGDFGDGGF